MTKEYQIEQEFIQKLIELKYTYRPDITDRKSLELNFRNKFEALNKVQLTDHEFLRLRDEITIPDVFQASKKLREMQYFQRDDGTPLHYTLLNNKDWYKKHHDVLFINASEHFDKNKGQNSLSEEHIEKIVYTYKYRRDEERFSRYVPMDEIESSDYNLNITRYVSTAELEPIIDLKEVNRQLADINKQIKESSERHNQFLRELGLEEV